MGKVEIDPSVKAVLVKTEGGKKYLKVGLYADAQSDMATVGNDGANVDGMSEDEVIYYGSTVFTSTMELGVLDSNGTWNF